MRIFTSARSLHHRLYGKSLREVARELDFPIDEGRGWFHLPVEYLQEDILLDCDRDIRDTPENHFLATYSLAVPDPAVRAGSHHLSAGP